MKKFGYSISKIRQIDYDLNDRSITDAILEREPSFRLCIECGGCSATCSAAAFTSFSLREYNVLLKRGEYDTVRENIHKCMLCGKCTLVCPRGVNTRNLIVLIRQALQQTVRNAV